MKFFIALSALVATTSATGLVGLASTGKSIVSRSEDGFGNYAFGYNEDHASGGTFRKEKGDAGMKIGSYGLREADGRMRVVNYVADALGYRASISTNEPGTDVKQDPASVNYNIGVASMIAPVALAAPEIKTFAVPAIKTFATPITSHTSVVKHHVAAPLAVAHHAVLAEPAIKTFAAPLATKVVHNSWAAPAVTNFAIDHVASPFATKVVHNSWAAPAISNFAIDHVASPYHTKVFADTMLAPAVAKYAAPVVAAKTFAAPAIANFATADWATSKIF